MVRTEPTSGLILPTEIAAGKEREYSLLEGLEMVRTEPTRGLILPTEIAAGKEAGGERS